MPILRAVNCAGCDRTPIPRLGARYHEGGSALQTYTAEQVKGLSGWIPEAIRQAITARQRAWVPVTKVRVGAAIAVRRGDAHDIIAGCNAERSTSLELHAEDVAVAQMLVPHGFDPKQPIVGCVVALVATRDEHHAFPCGDCRQLLHEYGGPGVMVYGVKLATDDATEPSLVERVPLYELLPYAFTPKHFRDISGEGK